MWIGEGSSNIACILFLCSVYFSSLWCACVIKLIEMLGLFSCVLIVCMFVRGLLCKRCDLQLHLWWDDIYISLSHLRVMCISFVVFLCWLSLNQAKKYQQNKEHYVGQIVLICPSCPPPADLVVKALKAASLMCIRQMGLKGILLYLIVPHNWIHLAESVCYWIMFHIGWMGSNCRYYGL